MNYIGEHLLPGQLGHFLVVLALIASLIATIAYFKASSATLPDQQESWKKIGRIAFVIDAFAVVGIFTIIFIIISRHFFEYYYAWNHSDTSLAPEYLLASIWEGQEGSFLLWAFWQGMMGLLLIRTAKQFEAPVMTVMSFAQLCLATMVLGVYLFGAKVGSSPFLLTRHMFQDAPIFNQPDYLSLPNMQNGNGLNQLLQNYWMVIHPPITFLGYASTLVPFAFAVGGMIKKDYGSWTKAALPWSLFSGAVLGLGIMMGAAWAYESLTFGGYWAWDPVENAVLVPWLVLVAGIHTQVIYNATGHSLRATNVLFVLQFLLVLYATYLTRSGDLQDTSVHAFVDNGMNWQLRGWVLLFTIPSLILVIARYKKIPHIAKEEEFNSREFWMFIGSLVLFLSAMAIIVPTSFPLINKVFGTSLVIGEDKEFPYNRIQVFVAIVIGVLSAITQYLKYKNTTKSFFWKKIMWATIASIVISLSVSIFGNINYTKYGAGFLAAIHLAIFAGVYGTVANFGYIFSGLKGKLKAAGASIAHVGFGILLVGILISSSKKEVLSINSFNPLNFGPDRAQEGFENLTLFQGIKTDMGKYWVTYTGDSISKNGRITYFAVDMQKKEGGESFRLYPDLIKNTKGQQGVSNNPDSRHYLHKDIFTYVNASSTLEGEDTAQYRNHSVQIGDTIFYSAGFITLDSMNGNAADTSLQAKLTVHAKDGRQFAARPSLQLKDNQPQFKEDTLFSQGLALRLAGMSGQPRFNIGVKESSKLAPFLALKVLQFPFINLVWLGTLIMVIGFIMSMVRRMKF